MPTVLVADDNSNIHKMVELALKDLGYRVEKVGNGEHAVRKIPEVSPDLILADIFMPVRNGYEVCEFVKSNEKLSHIPVVLLQGKFDPVDEQELKRVRADGLLMKPFVPPDPLITMVKSLLQESSQRGAAPPHPAVPKTPEATVEMSPAEIALLTGQKPPEAAAEPEVPDYSFRAPRVEFNEGEQPLAFGELLQAAPAEAEADELKESEEPSFQASGIAGHPFGKETPAVEEAPEKPSWGGIEEELKQPTPDEPPIKVEFGDSEPLEFITEEPSAPSELEVGRLEDLAATPDEWMQSTPSIPVPPDSEGWWVAPPAEIPPPEVLPPPNLGTPGVTPLPYETPGLEELPGATPQIDAVPAAAIPAVREPEPGVKHPAPSGLRSPAQVESFPAPGPVEPALVEAVVERVLARLQPQIISEITREIIRPLAEALLRKEQEK